MRSIALRAALIAGVMGMASTSLTASGVAESVVSSRSLLTGLGGRPSSSPNKRAPGAGMAFIRKARKLRNKRRS